MFPINAVISKGGSLTTIEVSDHLRPPLEVAQILDQKKHDLGFDFVAEINYPDGPGGVKLRWTGDASKDALAAMREQFKGSGLLSML